VYHPATLISQNVAEWYIFTGIGALTRIGAVTLIQVNFSAVFGFFKVFTQYSAMLLPRCGEYYCVDEK
jgi:hypothetical protein